MSFKRPKIIGTLKIRVMMAGNFAVVNGVKNAPNKIIIPVRSWEHGEEVIERITGAKFGDILHL